jgi:hypothetical protein
MEDHPFLIDIVLQHQSKSKLASWMSAFAYEFNMLSISFPGDIFRYLFNNANNLLLIYMNKKLSLGIAKGRRNM